MSDSFQEFKDRIEALENDCLKNNEKTKNQQISLEQLKYMFEDSKERTNKMENDLKNQEVLIASLRATNTDMEKRLRINETTIALLEERTTQLENRLKNEEERTNKMENDLKTQKDTNVDMEERLKNKENTIVLLEERTTQLENQLKIEEERITNLDNDLRIQEEISSGVIKRLDSDENTISLLKNNEADFLSRINLIDIRTNMTGEMNFVIEDIYRLIKIPSERISSPYFYSHLNGYKLRLQVSPVSSATSTSSTTDALLHVAIQICKGEYDDTLDWPCQYIFWIALVDPLSQGAPGYRKRMSYDNASTKDSYEKPNSVDNIGHGHSFSISQLENRQNDGSSVNDRIIIKCTVNEPPKK